MAVYDADAQRIIVRVVYDGPGRAGKTTNLERLCGFFTTMRRGELYTPAQSDQGRTLHFDWLSLEGGLIGGHRVRCQLVTVPGQRVLRSRRAHLIDSADVVVFVCEATLEGIDAALPMLRQITELRTEERPLPLVVQANKQDLPGSLSEEEMRKELSLEESVPVVPSQAHSGVGVRETAVLAVRAAATLLQRHVAQHGVRSLDGTAGTQQELLDEMQAIGIDFEVPDPSTVSNRSTARGRASREEADAELEAEVDPLDEVMEDDQRGSVAVSAPSTDPREAETIPPNESDVPEARPEGDSASVTPNDADEGSRRSWTQPAPGAPPPGGSLAERMAGFDPLLPTPVPTPRRATTPYPSGSHTETTGLPAMPKSAAVPPPPLPESDVSSIQLWPPQLGRQILQGLDIGQAVLRSDLSSQRGKADGSGSDTVIYEVDGWALKTRARRRSPDLEAGRTALVRLARGKVALEEMQPPQTVLQLQIDATDMYWLWTIAPWTPSLRAEMRAAEDAKDEEALGDALVAYADATIRSLVLAATHSVSLDVHPSNYARTENGVVYIDDDIGELSRIATAGFAMLRRVEEYPAAEGALERYVSALEKGIRTHIDAAMADALDLTALVVDAPTRTPAAEPARERLVEVLGTL